MKNAAAFVDFHRKLSTISIFYPQYVENTGFIGIYEEEKLWISCGESNNMGLPLPENAIFL